MQEGRCVRGSGKPDVEPSLRVVGGAGGLAGLYGGDGVSGVVADFRGDDSGHALYVPAEHGDMIVIPFFSKPSPAGAS